VKEVKIGKKELLHTEESARRPAAKTRAEGGKITGRNRLQLRSIWLDVTLLGVFDLHDMYASRFLPESPKLVQ
jgi:hypothetical protein